MERPLKYLSIQIAIGIVALIALHVHEKRVEREYNKPKYWFH